MMSRSEVLELAKRADAGDIERVFDETTALLNTEQDNPWVKFLYAKMSFKAQHYGVAKVMMESALATMPNNGMFHMNYALILDNLDELDAAIAAYRKAEADSSLDKSELYANYASTFLKMGALEKGADYVDRALKLNPGNKTARGTRAFVNFQLNTDLRLAWDDYTNLIGGQFRKLNDYGVPMWNGEPNARLIVQGEQGIGDEMMYASCLPDLIERGQCADIALDVDSRTVRLLRGSFPGIACYGSRAIPMDRKPWVHEFAPTHATLIGELPRLYRPDPEAFTGKSYLSPPDELVAMYRQLTRHATPAHTIYGIAWSGGSRNTHEKEREIPLAAFKSLIEAKPHAKFFSLQYRDGTEAEIRESGLPIKHFHWVTGKGANYEHTASFIKACDVIVSTDTTAIHAAGACGVKTHCLLSTPSMWLHPPWATERSVWYESVKLHRKPKGRSWESFMESKKEVLN